MRSDFKFEIEVIKKVSAALVKKWGLDLVLLFS